MSRTAKGTSQERVLAIVEKMDLDDAINLYHDVRDQLNLRLDERAKDLEEKQNRYLSVKEQINKNGNAGTSGKNS